MKQKLECFLETRQKKNSSATYQVIVIKLTDNTEKLIFPEPAELELLNLVNKK